MLAFEVINEITGGVDVLVLMFLHFRLIQSFGPSIYDNTSV